jgi:hypothetical protein
MIHSKHRAILLAILAVVLTGGVAPLCGAQVESGKPIKLKAPKQKLAKFKGEVLTATSVQIIVRSQDNERVVRTFSYSPKVQEQIQKIIDQGGYQHGDKVVIYHEPGSEVAVKITGKPSKSP